MKILFISHTFPPITGGVETQNYELSKALAKIAEVKLIANRKRWLILPFLLYSAIRALVSIRKYDVVVLGSCLLGFVGWTIKVFTDKPVLAVAHGLDLTWKNKIYQKLWLGIFIPKIDKLIAVGNETIRVAKTKGIAAEKLVFIPNGVNLENHAGNFSRADIEKLIGEKLAGRKVILTSGRLAKRKGVAWFIHNVMPKLSENIIYIIAGNGPEKENIAAAIKENNLSSRVKALGYVTDPERDMLFNTCDIFVQPNIKIPGDMEGFGISVIEAAYCGIPVIASNLEGLKDAIKDGQDGFLVETGDAEGYVKKINGLLVDDAARKKFGQKARQYVADNFSWEKVSQKYLEEITKFTKK